MMQGCLVAVFETFAGTSIIVLSVSSTRWTFSIGVMLIACRLSPEKAIRSISSLCWSESCSSCLMALRIGSLIGIVLFPLPSTWIVRSSRA